MVKITALLVALMMISIVIAQDAMVRFAHTLPSEGEADTLSRKTGSNSYDPDASFFDVAPFSFTQYKPLEPGTWKFNTTFATGAQAKSGAEDVSGGQYYTVYSYKKGNSNYKNDVINDGTFTGGSSTATATATSTSGGVPIEGNAKVRAVNVASWNDKADVFQQRDNETSPSLLFENLRYGRSTDYVDFPSGVYTFEYTLDNKKRNIEQCIPSCNRSAFITPERRYTIWLTSGGTLVTSDASNSKKRSVAEIRKKRIAARQALDEKAAN